MTTYHETGSAMPHRMSRDHILPRAWGGTRIEALARNWRWCCQKCNNDRAVCGHCPAALACVRDLAHSTGKTTYEIMIAIGIIPVAMAIPVPQEYLGRKIQDDLSRKAQDERRRQIRDYEAALQEIYELNRTALQKYVTQAVRGPDDAQ